MSITRLTLVLLLAGSSTTVPAQEGAGYFEFKDFKPEVEISPMSPMVKVQHLSKNKCDVLVKITFETFGKGELLSYEITESDPPEIHDEAAVNTLKTNVPLFDNPNTNIRVVGEFIYYGAHGCGREKPQPLASASHNKTLKFVPGLRPSTGRKNATHFCAA